MSCRVLTSGDFARLLGVHETKARDALRRMAESKPFAPRHLGRGAVKQVIPVQRLAALPGGAGGERFAVAAADIPQAWIRHPELLDEFDAAARPSTALVPYIPPPPPAIGPSGSRALTVAPFDAETEARAIGAALVMVGCKDIRLAQAAAVILEKTAKRSPERAALVNAVCGVVPGIARASLYAAIERGGERRPRKRRADAGARRVHLSAAFDEFAVKNGIAPDRLAELAERMRRKIRGAWQSASGNAAGWRGIRDNMGAVLRTLFSEFGAAIALPSRRELERLIPAHVVKRESHHRDAAIRRHDAGRHYNRHRVPVRRALPRFPGQVVCVDAKVIDVNIQCEDRALRSVKIAAAMDVATGYMIAVLIDPNEKRGVRQADTLAALALFCRDFAVPEVIQRDNGKEYDMPEVYAEVTGIVRGGLSGDRAPLRANPELKAIPYNAGAKPIEPAFIRATKVIFELLPGAHSGAWSNKRTQRQGQPPTPYPGTFTQFCEAFQKMMRLLNEDTPYRSGRRKGKTPRELINEAIARGWKASAQLTQEEVGFVFSKRDRRVVQPGGRIDFKGYTFYASALASSRWIGREVEVRWPLVGTTENAPPVLHVVDPTSKQRICVAGKGRVPYLGEEGLALRRQLDRESREHDAALQREADPCDPFEHAMARADALPPAAPIPTEATAAANPDGVTETDGGLGGTSPAGRIVALDSPEHRKTRERKERDATLPKEDWRLAWKRFAS